MTENRRDFTYRHEGETRHILEEWSIEDQDRADELLKMIRDNASGNNRFHGE